MARAKKPYPFHGSVQDFTAEKVPVYLYMYKGLRPIVQGTDVFANRTELTENEKKNFIHTHRRYISSEET